MYSRCMRVAYSPPPQLQQYVLRVRKTHKMPDAELHLVEARRKIWCKLVRKVWMFIFIILKVLILICRYLCSIWISMIGNCLRPISSPLILAPSCSGTALLGLKVTERACKFSPWKLQLLNWDKASASLEESATSVWLLLLVGASSTYLPCNLGCMSRWSCDRSKHIWDSIVFLRYRMSRWARRLLAPWSWVLSCPCLFKSIWKVCQATLVRLFLCYKWIIIN